MTRVGFDNEALTMAEKPCIDQKLLRRDPLAGRQAKKVKMAAPKPLDRVVTQIGRATTVVCYGA